MEKEMPTVDCKAPAVVASAVTNAVCEAKANSSLMKLIVLGFLAGCYIAFGAMIATLIGHDTAKFVGVGITKFLMGSVFSVGLMLVVIGGAELFTGNNLMSMGGINRTTGVSKVLRNWVVVYIANFVGSIFMAYLMLSTNLWQGNSGLLGEFAVKIANAKVNLDFMEAFTRGILCNWLVCMAVWMAIASKTVIGKIFSCFFPIMTFVALGFEHCVANMYFISFGLFLKGTSVATATGLDLGGLTWGGFLGKNLLPVTLGNIVGGAFFVGALYWFTYVRKGK